MSRYGTLVQQNPGIFVPQSHMPSPPISKHPSKIKSTKKRKLSSRNNQLVENKNKQKKLDETTKITIDILDSSSDEENSTFQLSNLPSAPNETELFTNLNFSNPFLPTQDPSPSTTAQTILIPLNTSISSNTSKTSCNNSSSLISTPVFPSNNLFIHPTLVQFSAPQIMPAPSSIATTVAPSYSIPPSIQSIPEPPRFKSISPVIPISVDIGSWLWWDESDFKEFSQDLSLAIESAFKSGKNDYTFGIDQQKSTYTIYFDIMVQQNNQTGFRRQIQRKITNSTSIVVEIPLNRFNVDYTFHFQYPAEWEIQNDICELKELSTVSAEYLRIDSLVYASLDRNDVQIVSIHRIQNQHLWRRYYFERSHIQQKNGGSFNEIEAFHGTRTTDPVEIYCGEEGFDMRYSNQGRWGTGIYFASKASYSINFAYSANPGQRQILLSRVALGSSFSCLDGDSSLRTPPEKNKTEGARTSRIPFSTDFHDSVVGVSGNAQIYTVYSNSKAYPSYLITFAN